MPSLEEGEGGQDAGLPVVVLEGHADGCEGWSFGLGDTPLDEEEW